jgi:2-dehydro-3-deoxygalactonokinase
VIAAGMITSNLGLYELKHGQAPVGIGELAFKIEKKVFPEIVDLPFFFVPGVRSGPTGPTLDDLNTVDIIRGEETEVLGALHGLQLRGPLLYIHLGSHTKLIKVDESNRIEGSRSTLAGELLQAVRDHTILKDSLPYEFDAQLSSESLDYGWKYAREYGFFRALYLIRVLQLNSSYSREYALSLLLGAILSEEFLCLDSFLTKDRREQLILSGLPQLQPAWQHFLNREARQVLALSAGQTEAFFLTGLYEILKRHNAFQPT